MILDLNLKQDDESWHHKGIWLVFIVYPYIQQFRQNGEIGYGIDPSLCQAKQFHVEIEGKGEFTAGMTVADNRPTRLFKDKMKEVTWVCYKVKVEKFEKLFFKRVKL